MRLTSIKRAITECGKPVIKIEAQSECLDKIGGNYYGVPGRVIQGSEGVTPFAFRKVTNIRGFVKDTPRTIERFVSQNCRTQLVRSSEITEIQGGDMYPAWKMREIEEMFHQKQIIIDGQEVVWRGGELFTRLGSCLNYFRFIASVEECTKQQIYGCSSECSENTMYFIIPDRIVTQTFFNESGLAVANTYQSLLDYYRAQSGIIEVEDIPGDLQIRCDYFKVFKVRGTGYIPSVFYFDEYSNSNKVIGMFLDSEDPDYNLLCRGIDNQACARVQILPITITEIACLELTLGTPVVTELGCTVIPFEPAWEQHSGDTSIFVSGNARILNLSVINDLLISTGGEPVEATWDYTVPSDMPDNCVYNTPIPPTATILEVRINSDLPLDPTEYNFTAGVLTFNSDCPVEGDLINVKFEYTSSSTPVLSGDIIAKIQGTNCTPKSTIYLSHTSFDVIPSGATLIIQNDGNIRWYGPVTSSDMSGSVIEITNIIYSV